MNILFKPELWKYIDEGIKSISPYNLDDIRQNCLVKILKKEHASPLNFENEDAIKKYLVVVGKNGAKDYFNQTNKRQREKNEYIYSFKVKHYDDDLFMKISSVMLRKAVDRLPPEQRKTIILYYYEGYSYKEIAKILNKNESTVGNCLLDARKNLKKYLEKG